MRADRDRPDAYGQIAGRRWDAVIDVARQPGHVRRAGLALAASTDVIVFVSSASVYADHATPGQAEDAALLPASDGDVMESMDTCGEAKVACEQHVLETFGAERALIACVG